VATIAEGRDGTGARARARVHIVGLHAHLVNAIETVLHALDGSEAVGLHTLRFQDLRKGALPLFGNQPVLLHRGGGTLLQRENAPLGAAGTLCDTVRSRHITTS
jgi:hypothetical protein